MIIFGWRNKIYIIGLLHKQICNNCHNEEYWLLKKSTKWFTLFFIPAIPVQNKYFTCCPICDKGFFITKEEAKKLIPIAELNLKLAKGLVAPEQYSVNLHNLDSAQVLDPKFLSDAPGLTKYLAKTHSSTSAQNKIIGGVLLVAVIVLWAMGDGGENYNGYLVAAGWFCLVGAIIFFNSKNSIFKNQ